MTWRCGLALVLVVLLGAAATSAHEVGTTRVSVIFDSDRTYAIDIVTDAGTLVEKLEAASGRDAGPADMSDLEARIRALEEVFRQRVTMAFDGSIARPSLDVVVTRLPDATASPVASIRLRGEVPDGARAFTWKYGWTFASYALTIRRRHTENGVTVWLEGGQPSAPFSLTTLAPAPTRAATAWRYVRLGFVHIIPKGLDHILFALGLVLLSRQLRPVLLQVSAFTVAHSITLGLSLYGAIAVPADWVEPLIALSIVYVAVENLFTSRLQPWRVALVFGFGLLHGLGFAGVLQEVGLPRSEFVTALLTFNLGVELGQLAVIGAAFALVGWFCGRRAWYRRLVVVPASAIIAFVALYWTIARIVS
jgi:hypothetical protein